MDEGGQVGKACAAEGVAWGSVDGGSSGRAGERRQEGGSLVVLPMAVLKLSIDIVALS